MDVALWKLALAVGGVLIAAIGIMARLADIPKIWKVAKSVWSRLKPVHDLKIRDAKLLAKTFYGMLQTHLGSQHGGIGDVEVVVEVVLSTTEKIRDGTVDLDLGGWGRYQAVDKNNLREEPAKVNLEPGDKLMRFSFRVPFQNLQIAPEMKAQFKPEIRLRSDKVISAWLPITWPDEVPPRY
jgi:hypothetical protein